MKNILKLFYFLFFIFYFLFNYSYADIDITVSPVKYELTIEKGQSENKIVKIFNNTNYTQEIFVTSRNAISMEDNGQPIFVEEIEEPDLHIANWIVPSVTSFSIDAGKDIDIPFAINVPNNAAPGGHYGAIFFNVKELNSGQINIQKRIGVIMLLKVPGELKAEGEVKSIDIVVRKSGGGGRGSKKSGTTVSRMSDIFKKYVLGENLENNPTLAIDENSDLSSAKDDGNNSNKDNENNNTTSNEKNDFGVDLSIDFSNKGNTHIKPIGKIEIIDENGHILKKIGKESIKNEDGAIIGERVVDYLPINDENGNILPNENKKFNQSWNGFAYETIDDDGKKIIKYYDPSEFYSIKNKVDNGYLMPWERICTREVSKKLTAKINLGYTSPDGKEVDFNSAKDFFITYDEEYVGLNWYVLTPILIVLLLIITFWIIGQKRKKKCENCNKTIKKDMQICPYCGEKNKVKNKKSK